MRDHRQLSAFLNGFAPRSALLCSVEGDPPGDGGGAPPNAPPPAPAPQAPPTFTAEQEAVIRAREEAARNAGAAATRRAHEQRQAKPGGEPAPSNPPAPISTEGLSEPARERMFGRALGRFDLDDRAVTVVERDYARDKPADPVAWLNERADAFQWRRLGESPTPPHNAPPSPAALAAPAPADPAKPAPSGAPSAPSKVIRIDSGQLIDVSSLTGDEITQLGTAGIREHLEKVIAAGQARDGRPALPQVLRKK